jgi:polar amino acid transport system substrate-binding protein
MAQTAALPKGEISVATRVLPPFVTRQGDDFSGFSVELWRAIALELDLKSRFTTHGPLNELLKAVREGRDPVGIAAISITAERLKQLEFSQPMLRSGLSILVPNNQSINILDVLFSREMLLVLGVFLFLLIVPAHIIWWLARDRDDGLPISESYYPGIIDALFWCAESLAGVAKEHPTKVFARVAALIWVYAGVVMIAYFTAFATTSLTVNSLQSDISGPKDLAGKRVAVVKGSTSAKYAETLKASTVPFAGYEEAAEAMIAGKADAVLYDTPMLLSLSKNDPRVRITGPQFKLENYGIAFPLNSQLRRSVDAALLKLIENGTYNDLHRKYFGQE